MVPDDQGLLAAPGRSVQEWSQRLKPAKHLLHAGPVGTIVQMGSEDNHLGLLLHLGRILELRIPAVDSSWPAVQLGALTSHSGQSVAGGGVGLPAVPE